MEKLFENLRSLKQPKGDLQGDLQCLLEPPAASTKLLPFVGLWPKTIKLNPSLKTEVSKGAWINPCTVGLALHLRGKMGSPKISRKEVCEIFYKNGRLTKKGDSVKIGGA